MVEGLVWLGTWVFAATGALKGVEKGLDLLSGEVPGILYRAGDLYASAALVGALVVYALHGSHPEGPSSWGP